MALSKTTQDHDEIRKWAEERGAIPADVSRTAGAQGTGIIRLMFPKAPHAKDGALEEISWDEFFEKFDASDLALVYQNVTADGEQSNFNKLIHPTDDDHPRRQTGRAGSPEKPSANAAKTGAKKTAGAKSSASKSGSGNALSGRAAVKEGTGSKGGGSKSSAKKTSAKKSAAKSSGGGREAASKTATKGSGRSTANTSAGREMPAKNAGIKKAAAKKAAGKKTAAKKTGARK